MTLAQIAKQYIHFLEQVKTDDIVALFSNKGIVISPLYGDKPAKEFYTLLAQDTTSSELTVNHIFEDDIVKKVALYFTFNWTLKNNEQVVFNAVDILEFDTNNKIEKLTIIYDTVIAREIFNTLNNS